jgi:hypothetical protein
MVKMAATITQELKGNEKRKQSCKLVGGEKKRTGHARERLFTDAFGDAADCVTYKAEADCRISVTNPATATLLESLSKTLNLDLNDRTSLYASIKSGNNLQFTLGNIPEITGATDKIAAMSSPALWKKYLQKSESANPAGLLVYYIASPKPSWTFFKMDTAIDFIVKKCVWRLLDTGRLKGDFIDSSKKGVSQYLTYEYRNTHKSYFLGANGGKGLAFMNLLKANIPYYVHT